MASRVVPAKLLLASTNAGKIRELKALIGLAFQVMDLGDLPGFPEVAEDQDSFQANARKKALAYARWSRLPTLADDSGLCVEALGGAPGVLSARYASGTDADRVVKLLANLADVPASERGASFVCALSLATPDGESVTVTGICSGSIGFAPRGTNGFGYDPIFQLADGRTMAELSLEEKARISHRAAAFRQIEPYFSQLLSGGGTSASP